MTDHPPPSASPSLAELRSTDARISQSAWSAAYPRLWQAVSGLLAVNLLTGTQHVQDREDLAARALSELVRGVIEGKPESFNQIASFDDMLSMALQIVRARTKDFFRRQGRRLEDLTDDPPETPAPAGEAESKLSREEFDALTARLPPPQPVIFHLHYVQGHTAEEIADQLGMPRNTVLSHLFRGKKTLRKWLDELFGSAAPRDSHSPDRP